MTTPSVEYRTIVLSNGMTAFVSPRIFESDFRWHVRTSRTKGRIQRYIFRHAKGEPDGPYIYLHRLVLGLHKGDPRTGDHENHDTLDNTDQNLRIATRLQQQRHTKKPITNTSGYKGVCWQTSADKWTVGISVNNKRKHLGLFPRHALIEAAKAYDAAAKQIFGEFADLNFPEHKI